MEEIEELKDDIEALETKFKNLSFLAAKVVMLAQEASLAMPEVKIVRMETSDFRALRDLVAGISELNKALSGDKE